MSSESIPQTNTKHLDIFKVKSWKLQMHSYLPPLQPVHFYPKSYTLLTLLTSQVINNVNNLLLNLSQTMQTKHTWLHNLRFIFFIQVWWYSNPTFQCWSFCIVLHTQSGCRCHLNINSVMNSGTSGHGRFNAWSPTLGVSCGILSAAATGRVASWAWHLARVGTFVAKLRMNGCKNNKNGKVYWKFPWQAWQGFILLSFFFPHFEITISFYPILDILEGWDVGIPKSSAPS